MIDALDDPLIVDRLGRLAVHLLHAVFEWFQDDPDSAGDDAGDLPFQALAPRSSLRRVGSVTAFMAAAVIDNPILNSPFDEPTRHWKFDRDGITTRSSTGAASRRISCDPKSKRGPGQMQFQAEWTADRIGASG
jgi:hypothetical protein